jgi:ubiquitin-like 1-activating enzyme E1 B
LFAEIFGTSEDEAPELDHSEDSENAKEVANLRMEAQALKRIRESMGSEEFPRLLFNKVYKEDIERLRSMEGMWKTKRAPEALDYDTLLQESLGCGPAVAQQDQVVWNTAENFAVFVDSLRRLSSRLEDLRANAEVGNSAPILTFDKDDVDTLDFVTASANLRSFIFGIETRSKFDIKRKFSQNLLLRLLTYCRNGWQHHPRNRHHKRHDSWTLRAAGLQSHARTARQG